MQKPFFNAQPATVRYPLHTFSTLFTPIRQRGICPKICPKEQPRKTRPMSALLQPQGDEPLSGHAFPLLYNLVYCSRATPGVDDAAVDCIIESARRLNPARGITGLLVYGGGLFFQWLEGPRHSILELMDTLKTDPRHESIVSLSVTEEVRERLFPDWDMELVTGTDIRDVLVDALEHAKDKKSAASLHQLLAQLDSGQLGVLT